MRVALRIALGAGVAGTFGLQYAYWLGHHADTVALVVFSAATLGVILGAFAVRARRPDSPVGQLLLIWGAINALGGLGAYEYGGLLILWFSVQPLHWTLLAHALLTYPHGRIRPPERWFLVAAYAMPGYWFSITLFSPTQWLVSFDGPANPVLIMPNLGLATVAWRVNAVLATGMGLWFVGLLRQRYRAATPAQRRTARPVVWATGALAAGYLAHAAIDLARVKDPLWWDIVLWIGRVAPFGVPAALVVGLLTTKLARADVATLLLGLRCADVDTLGPPLAELLRDPTVAIVTEVPPGDPRAIVDLGGGRYLLTHHGTRAEDPDLFDAGVTAVRITIDNHRLVRQVADQLAEVSASRERLVRVADDERRRVERDLHDGAQQQLLGLGMALRSARLSVADGTETASILDDAAHQLRSSLTELRTLARGLRPALLTERGLPDALAELRRRVPVPVTLLVDVATRPPVSTETAAYFVVAEALQNVARHAPGARATVTVTADGRCLRVDVTDDGPGGASVDAGTGLRGLADRVAAAGGRFIVDGGAGTTIRAELPL